LAKILSQAGISLADTYEVEGSIVGIDTLESRELPIVHEMGATIFSERLTTHIIRISSGVIAQNDDFDIASAPFADCANRVLGVEFIADVAGRIDNVALMLLDPNTLNNPEYPIATWNSAAATTAGAASNEATIRFNNAGAGPAAMSYLRPNLERNQMLIARMGVAVGMPTLILRGTAAAFGAGNVELVAFVYIARPNPLNITPASPSSHGLPVPSW